MLGYDFHPGGLWAGRYRVLSWKKMRENPELTPNKATIQYVDSVFPSTCKRWYFPLGILRRNHEEGMLEEMWKLSVTELRQRMADLAAEWDSSQPAPEPEVAPPSPEDEQRAVEGPCGHTGRAP